MDIFSNNSIKSNSILYLLVNLTKLKNNLLKSRKIKPSFEINWKIREIFSEAALAGFCDEIWIENTWLLKKQRLTLDFS